MNSPAAPSLEDPLPAVGFFQNADIEHGRFPDHPRIAAPYRECSGVGYTADRKAGRQRSFRQSLFGCKACGHLRHDHGATITVGEISATLFINRERCKGDSAVDLPED